jgi:hypothetical protein
LILPADAGSIQPADKANMSAPPPFEEYLIKNPFSKKPEKTSHGA